MLTKENNFKASKYSAQQEDNLDMQISKNNTTRKMNIGL
jgi:hypothetical protein